MSESQANNGLAKQMAGELVNVGLAKRMASEIVLSETPWVEIRAWRLYFKVSQKNLANKMGITSSVISDYESGRRKSPGIAMIKKIIVALTGYNPLGTEVKNG